jgi:hypothetical protein
VRRAQGVLTDGDAHKCLFIVKGGSSGNKSYLYQETKAVLNPTRMASFLEEKIQTIATFACPPYRLTALPPYHRGRRDQGTLPCQQSASKER